MILPKLVKFVVGSWPCVSCLGSFEFRRSSALKPWQNSKDGAQIGPKFIKNRAWERLGAIGGALGNRSAPGPHQGGTIFLEMSTFWRHLADLGRLLEPSCRQMAAQGSQNGGPNRSKSMQKSMQKSMPKKLRKILKIDAKMKPKWIKNRC